mmetsp:Transcript_7043/g.16325  ORF Transcript_7043/g.16325 Transcript_7043/m.16325 type:complete len:84 (-) Transcript_7043:1382-1633(-)
MVVRDSRVEGRAVRHVLVTGRLPPFVAQDSPARRAQEDSSNRGKAVKACDIERRPSQNIDNVEVLLKILCQQDDHLTYVRLVV